MIGEAIIFALAIGGALGAFFFGGLWWTVSSGLVSPAPAVWFFCSLLLRTGVTVIGFVLVSCGHWERALACLLGFLIARFTVTRLTGRSAKENIPLTEGANHAP